MMSAAVRKGALTLHVAASVGWLGSVAAFLALALYGLKGDDALRVRGAYLAMDLVTWAVIVPLAFAALVTGVVQALGTTWGLFRHYWVVMKLVLTVVATAVLLLHTGPIRDVADLAARQALSFADVRELRVQLVADAVAALIVLLAVTTLSVVKPRGLTRHGHRAQVREQAERGAPA